jgi:5-methylcytosine-specific restriction endonuclease McrA
MHDLAEGKQDEAMVAITTIAYARHEVPKRRNTAHATIVETFRRDKFTCRFCGRQVVAQPILRLLSTVFPNQFPHHINWRAGQTHPAINVLSAQIDHLVAGTRGGSWTDKNNLVTACAQCNYRKGDFTPEEVGLEVRPIADTDWDGLTSLYAVVWEKAGKPEPKYHSPWLRLYGHKV